MKIVHYILFALVIALLGFVVSTSLTAGESWYRAKYEGAKFCYINGDNPYNIKPENMCFFPTRTQCVATLGGSPMICDEK